ncbi:MAG: exonuclease, partial [Lachnospiraceae bacterium]|nr:exonuclease [Lachnospiraceae bacterium]
NYKDYYYLPCEDTAIHKSVGEYVAREARIKATAKTCYTRKSGLFLPQLPDAPLWQPVFQTEYKAKIAYAAYTEALLSDPGTANTYLHQLLTEAVKKES